MRYIGMDVIAKRSASEAKRCQGEFSLNLGCNTLQSDASFEYEPVMVATARIIVDSATTNQAVVVTILMSTIAWETLEMINTIALVFLDRFEKLLDCWAAMDVADNMRIHTIVDDPKSSCEKNVCVVGSPLWRKYVKNSIVAPNR